MGSVSNLNRSWHDRFVGVVGGRSSGSGGSSTSKVSDTEAWRRIPNLSKKTEDDNRPQLVTAYRTQHPRPMSLTANSMTSHLLIRPPSFIYHHLWCEGTAVVCNSSN
ncbi:hypothetical protein AKJ16_DCAP24700 [Drosera capensis]